MALPPTTLSSLQLVPVTRIEKNYVTNREEMDGNQQMRGGCKEDRLESSGDDEVVLTSHNKGVDLWVSHPGRSGIVERSAE